ncbi:hypothetical protein MFTT_00260 [Mycolicibacterium fortuitum subsp. fortuitum]|nr:hypothetical protein MFTT_00260 [Mycolicibacterium fortuitum subsp. fortuitum]
MPEPPARMIPRTYAYTPAGFTRSSWPNTPVTIACLSPRVRRIGMPQCRTYDVIDNDPKV